MFFGFASLFFLLTRRRLPWPFSMTLVPRSTSTPLISETRWNSRTPSWTNSLLRRVAELRWVDLRRRLQGQQRQHLLLVVQW
jgi:hypothetical protein